MLHVIPRYVYFAYNDSRVPVAFDASAILDDDDVTPTTAHWEWIRGADAAWASGWRRTGRFVVNVTNVDDDTAGVRVLQRGAAHNELDSFDDDPDLTTAIFDERYYKANRVVGAPRRTGSNDNRGVSRFAARARSFLFVLCFSSRRLSRARPVTFVSSARPAPPLPPPHEKKEKKKR
jgi:hypothetical protein